MKHDHRIEVYVDAATYLALIGSRRARGQNHIPARPPPHPLGYGIQRGRNGRKPKGAERGN